MKRSLGLLAVVAFGLLAARPIFAQAVPLTILHTNDTHGHLFPFTYPDAVVRSQIPGLRTYKDIGGIARRATLVRQIRQELQARKTPVWLVDVGDYSDGTPFSIEKFGEAEVASMNAAGYDLGTLGNHEFNTSTAQLKKLIAATKYTLLNANVTERGTGKSLVTPFVVRRVGPIRVGIFGLVTTEAGGYPAARSSMDVAKEVEAARKVVATLRKQADVVVLLSHAGEGKDQVLAAEVPGIDVIVGGHSHSRLPLGEFVWRSEDLRADDVNGTVIVQAHQWGGELGRLDLLFVRDRRGAWHVDRYRARLLPVTSDIEPDPAVAAVVEGFWRPIAAKYGEVIGQASGDFCGQGQDQAEYNLVADAVRESYGTDFAVENMGGVRAPLLKGPITYGDLVTMDPFTTNTVVLFKVTGRELRKLLLDGRMPAVSGLRYRVENKAVVQVTVAGQPLEDDKTYSGVTNSYFAGQVLKNVQTEDTKRKRLDVVMAYIREKGTVSPAYDGRRVVVGN